MMPSSVPTLSTFKFESGCATYALKMTEGVAWPWPEISIFNQSSEPSGSWNILSSVTYSGSIPGLTVSKKSIEDSSDSSVTWYYYTLSGTPTTAGTYTLTFTVKLNSSYSSGTKTTTYPIMVVVDSTSPSTIQVSFDSNGGSGGPSSTYSEDFDPSDSLYYDLAAGISVNSRSVQFFSRDELASLAKPTRSGYTFAWWETESGLSTKTLKEITLSVLVKSPVIYLAQWGKRISIIYDDRGGSGGPGTVATEDEYYIGKYIYRNTNVASPTRPGYIFRGWGASVAATSVEDNTIYVGDSFTDSTYTLYAIWIEIRKVTYDANGGEGAPDPTEGTTLSTVVPTRNGYKFLGWGISAGAESASYQPGGTVSLSTSITVYAIWTPLVTITYDAKGGTPIPGPDIGSTSTTTAAEYTTIIAAAPSKAGHIFLYWTDVDPDS